MSGMNRRDVLKTLLAAAVVPVLPQVLTSKNSSHARGKRPNIVFVLADQWRAQATGYGGDPNALTPNLNRLASESVQFTHAVSGCPVCSPYRGSLMTGQYWLTHGIFTNDVCLNTRAVTIVDVLGDAGYDTAYIGKWHLDGHGRSAFIPRERRHGFGFWRAMECTHDYNNSFYYADEPEKLRWDGYDAIAQTREAQRYLRERSKEKPFALFLSWGPPHDPYGTAPQEYQQLHDPQKIRLRPNVPKEVAEKARKDLAGYYAHISALDACVGDLLRTLSEIGIAEKTVFVFTSDHGDMLYSLGRQKKQVPFDESIRVPFLVRYPAGFGDRSRTVDTLLNVPDIMPTLLGLCGIGTPPTCEGTDFSGPLLRGRSPRVDAALLMSPAPFANWSTKNGGREYRGIRTKRYTYVRDLNGPWLLYDNKKDPFQLDNLCNRREWTDVQKHLDKTLARKLRDTHDEFQPAEYYLRKWGYEVDETGTVPYAQ